MTTLLSCLGFALFADWVFNEGWTTISIIRAIRGK
jgi:hypothetical protein